MNGVIITPSDENVFSAMEVYGVDACLVVLQHVHAAGTCGGMRVCLCCMHAHRNACLQGSRVSLVKQGPHVP